VLSALGSTCRAGCSACLEDRLHDGVIFANAPMGNSAGRHADLRAIEGMPNTLGQRWPIEETQIRDPIARLRAGMALLNASGQRALQIGFDMVDWFDGYLHVHDAFSCNRPVM
jgi:hypothetical protein